MSKKYDVIIVGGGVAGTTAALGLADAGESIAIIENDLWGGTCPNRGCDPKKILLAAVEAKKNASQLMGKGIKVKPAIDWPDLMAFKNTYTDPVPQNTKNNLQNSDIDVYEGTSHFINNKEIKINDSILKANRFILTTGARPSILDIKGKEYLLTSRDFLNLSEMPDSITFIGGGYVGFEFAAIANAAGAKVHLIHHNSEPLKDYNQKLVQDLMKQLKKDGVKIYLETEIKQIKQEGDAFLLSDEKEFNLKTDLVFGSTGRLPNIENLNLGKAGVKVEKKGIQVNEYLQTSNSSIYAAGDVLAKTQPKLTPVAILEASYLVSHLTNKNKSPIIYPHIPTIVFSSPKLAQIGVSAEEAEQHPDKYECSTIDATNWFSYFRINEDLSKIKIVTEKDTELLVGASVLNNEADTLINFFSMLINKKIKATELSDVVFAYPSLASDLPHFYN